MIYQSSKVAYSPVMTVLKTRVNDVLICRDAHSRRDSFYTLWVLKDHATVKKLINVLQATDAGYEVYVDFFLANNQYCLAFPHVQERKLQDFYMVDHLSVHVCTSICKNLVMACMLSKLPYPLLYLVLQQDQLHLLKDNEVELGYCISLEELDENKTEKDCAIILSRLVRDLLKAKPDKKNIGYKLLDKKLPRESYTSLQELYRDLKITAEATEPKGFRRWLKRQLQSREKDILRTVLIICLVLIIFTVVCFISRAIFGDVPILRLFFNHFKVIGTETLK